MIEARSIHPIPAPVDDHPSPDEALPRLRRRTNDPAREYAQRGGGVAPLPDSIAALILCKKGWAKIERHQIKVTLDGEELYFASRDSLVIAAKNGTGEPVLWAMNRRAPDVLHLLTDDGRYLESVPRKGVATWFDHSAASQAAHADATAQIQRDAARLQELHRPDTEAAAAAAQHNAAQTQRLIQTFPVADLGRDRTTAQPGVDNTEDNIATDRGGETSFAQADRLVEVMASTDRQRARQVSREQAARHSRAQQERESEARRAERGAEMLDALLPGAVEADAEPEPTPAAPRRTSFIDAIL